MFIQVSSLNEMILKYQLIIMVLIILFKYLAQEIPVFIHIISIHIHGKIICVR